MTWATPASLNHGKSDKLIMRHVLTHILPAFQDDKSMFTIISQKDSFDETLKGRFQKMACGVENLSGLKFLNEWVLLEGIILDCKLCFSTPFLLGTNWSPFEGGT